MKNLAFALILLCFNAAVISSRAAEGKPDPSQYPLVMHVSASRYRVQLIGGTLYPDSRGELLTATVGNKHYQLDSSASSAKAFRHDNGLIDPGDYRAKLTQDEHKTSYESLQQFEILFPDGATCRFDVIGQSE